MIYVYIAGIAVFLSILLLFFSFLNRRYIIVKVTQENALSRRKIPYDKINAGICIVLFLTLFSCTVLYISQKTQPEQTPLTVYVNDPWRYEKEYKAELEFVTNKNFNFSLLYHTLFDAVFPKTIASNNIDSLGEKMWFSLDKGTKDKRIYFSNEDFTIDIVFDADGNLLRIVAPHIILRNVIKNNEQFKYMHFAYELKYANPNFLLADTTLMDVSYESDVVDILSLLTDFDSAIRAQYGQTVITLSYTKS